MPAVVVDMLDRLPAYERALRLELLADVMSACDTRRGARVRGARRSLAGVLRDLAERVAP